LTKNGIYETVYIPGGQGLSATSFADRPGAGKTGRSSSGELGLATIRDVAREADVSIATVSRVFNNSSLVSEDTAKRVMQVAARFDYWPNSAAQSLTTNRSNTLGVLLPDLFGEFYSEVIRGIDSLARRTSYQIMLSSSHADNEEILMAARSMLGRIDGLLMMAPDDASADTVNRIRRRIPLVLLNPATESTQNCSVSIDNFSGAREAVNHLLKLGHPRIAMVAGPQGNVDANERLRGFTQALSEAGHDPRDAIVVQGDFREPSGFSAGIELMKRVPRPSAVFVANDSMAVGLLAALENLGVDVPGDLAVVGFDDVDIAGYLRPPLTTVHIDAFALGQRAAQMMVNEIQSPAKGTNHNIKLPAVLKIRRSCGAQPNWKVTERDKKSIITRK
jgi:LacI family transcriptional regulator